MHRKAGLNAADKATLTAGIIQALNEHNSACPGQNIVYVSLDNFVRKTKFDLHSQKEYAIMLSTQCGSGSVGRAKPCQGLGREFESRLPLQ